MENLVKYSIIIPTYNSGPSLEELCDRIQTTMGQNDFNSFETIFVNDASPNIDTWPIIQKLSDKYEKFWGINLLYNVGQFRALLCGMQHASGQFIIHMDDDLQHLPEELPKLITSIDTDNDVLCVMGKYKTKQHSLIRNAGSKLFKNLTNQMYGKKNDIQTSSFRIMRKELSEAILQYKTAKPQLGPLITTLTKRVKNIEVDHDIRKYGKSGYSFTKLVSHTFDSIVHASTAPLKFFSMIGFLIAGASLFIGLYFLYRWLSGGIGVPGFTSQILLITFFGGMTLAGIGILGEYIARIIVEVSGPRRFIVKETTQQ